MKARHPPGYKRKRPWVPKPKKERLRNGPQILTDAQVIELRQTVKRDGMLNGAHHAKTYHVVASVIRDAVVGKTFKHLNDVESPVTQKLKRSPSSVEPFIPEKTLILEALALCQTDPLAWSYQALTKWFKEKTGRKVGQAKIKRLLFELVPSLKNVISTHTEKSDEKKAERLELRRIIARENRYEKWIKAGKPGEEFVQSRKEHRMSICVTHE